MRQYLLLVSFILACNCLSGQRREDIAVIVERSFVETDSIVRTSHQQFPVEKGRVMTVILQTPVFFYQKLISSQMKPRCYFYPSCTQFAMDAIRCYGVTGIFMGADRIMRCNAFSEGKYPLHKETNLLYDPVDQYWFGCSNR